MKEHKPLCVLCAQNIQIYFQIPYKLPVTIKSFTVKSQYTLTHLFLNQDNGHTAASGQILTIHCIALPNNFDENYRWRQIIMGTSN